MIMKIFGKEEDFENEYLTELIDKINDEGFVVESYDLDKDEAHVQAEVYQIFTSPTVVITGEDGREVEIWRGRIPSVSEAINFLGGK